ncbi:MAG TPA: HD domain-containing phosphohydrolase [Nitrospirota bacterium]|nr:HD domain-containing phosphohydrolase [Nitrospirota bacterium]
MNKKIQLKRMIFCIESLVDLGQEVSSAKELAEKMRAALYVMTGIFSVPTAALFIYHPHRRCLDLFVDKGHRDKIKHDIQLLVPSTSVRRFRMNEPHIMSRFNKTKFYSLNEITFLKLQAKIFIPLFAKNEFVGAIALGKKLSGTPYPPEERDVLRVIAHQMAITLYNAQLFLELAKKASENKKLFTSMQRIYHDTIQAFAAAIDAKDDYTKDHSYRVASYAVAIARELGWKKNDVEGLYVAGLLHDIGKIIIDREIINKGENLTTPEIREIKRHPQISYNILSKVKFPWKNVENFVRHHHERLDGRGYPDALTSTQLTDGVKILTLADAFDAMTTDRPYRGKMALSEAFREVMRCKGTQFDTKISNTFFNILRKELNGEVKEQQILPHLRNVDVTGFRALDLIAAYEESTADRLPDNNRFILTS